MRSHEPRMDRPERESHASPMSGWSPSAPVGGPPRIDHWGALPPQGRRALAVRRRSLSVSHWWPHRGAPTGRSPDTPAVLATDDRAPATTNPRGWPDAFLRAHFARHSRQCSGSGKGQIPVHLKFGRRLLECHVVNSQTGCHTPLVRLPVGAASLDA